MLFMGPQTLLDLSAQFKQSLEKVTEALLPDTAPSPVAFHSPQPAWYLCASQSSLCQQLQPDATSSHGGAMSLMP